jgi:hypothetical protein
MDKPKGTALSTTKLGLRFLSAHFSSMQEQSMRSVPTLAARDGAAEEARAAAAQRKRMQQAQIAIHSRHQARTEYALEQKRTKHGDAGGEGGTDHAIVGQANQPAHQNEKQVKEVGDRDSFWVVVMAFGFMVLLVAVGAFGFPDKFEDAVFSMPLVGAWARSMHRNRMVRPFDDDAEVFGVSRQRRSGERADRAGHSEGTSSEGASSAGAMEWGAAASSGVPSTGSSLSTRRRPSAMGLIERRGSAESLNPRGGASYSHSEGDLDLI